MGNLSGVVPIEVVRAAMLEPALRGRVFLCSKRREPLYADGEVVGFVTPHQNARGLWRHGPIFVLPEYRRRGLVRAYYDARPGRDCLAFIAWGNEASFAMHVASGFVEAWRTNHGRFMRRTPR